MMCVYEKDSDSSYCTYPVCDLDDHCPFGQLCYMGSCVLSVANVSCHDDTHCMPRHVCKNNRCEGPPGCKESRDCGRGIQLSKNLIKISAILHEMQRKRYTTRNIPPSITFSPLHFMLYESDYCQNNVGNTLDFAFYFETLIMIRSDPYKILTSFSLAVYQMNY